MGRVRGKTWMQEHVADPYVKRARNEGMRSRAAYKLDEIAGRDRLLRPGMVVVDLGAAPGGQVIAVDVLDMTPLRGVSFIRGDFREEPVVAEVERSLGARKADLVLSDMAPNLTGIAVTDQARAMELGELALEFAMNHLKPQGNFLVKTFQGAGFEAFLKVLRGCFTAVAVRKPGASRDRSSEVYLVCKGLRTEKARA